MKIEFLVATVDALNTSHIEKIFKNLDPKDFSVLVINQFIKNEIPKTNLSNKNIKVICIKAKGTSVSRNLAIKNSTGDVCIFTDDDLVYEKNAIYEIKKHHTNSTADVITFQTGFINSKKEYKNYKDKSFKHNLYSLLSVGDCEITFKREAIIQSSLFFDERFGLNCRYPACEYQIFLIDCLKRKLNLIYIPKVIVRHPELITTGFLFESHLEIARGAGFARMLGLKSILAIFYFSLKKRKYYIKKHGFLKEIKLLTKGAIEVLKEK